MTRCHYCDREITFSDEHLSRNGKYIPQDVDIAGEILGNHRCPERQQEYAVWKQNHRRYHPCRKCGDGIYFDEKFKTDKGKWIPVDKQTEAPHLCIDR